MFTFRKPRWLVGAVSSVAATAIAAAVAPATVQAAPAGGVNSRNSSAAARYTGQRLDWTPCDRDPSLECAAMAVPATGITWGPART
ncbi:hypothetical protein AB5L52_01050 [Streptomyces sp. CG4]|uniref:hypothetical protein n=1 Tax=Streptomyces sp. CG4 TaxID=408783 RepID=UPI0034E2700B